MPSDETYDAGYDDGRAEALAAIEKDLTALLDYAQPDEERDYEREGSEAGDMHIVHAIRRLRAFLDDETEEEEAVKPDPNDAYIYDRASGPITMALDDRPLGVAGDVDDAVRKIARAMNDSAYWPNVWYVNERGNTTLIEITDADSGAYRFTDTAYV